MSVIHAPAKPEFGPRHMIVLGLMGAALTLIASRLWYVQVANAESLVTMADRTRRSAVSTPAPRGLIYDRRERLLAGVESQYIVTGLPAVVNKQPWVLDKLAGMLGVEKKKLEDKVKEGVWRPHLPTPLYADISVELATRIAEASAHLPGIGVDTRPMRTYTNTVDLSHVLGYVWTPSASDLDRIEKQLEGTKRVPAPLVGKIGLERQYEVNLMGEPGQEVLEVDNKRRPLRVAERHPGRPGDRLNLTIDSDLQKYSNAVLASFGKRLPESGSAAVALDPQTGEILCLSSNPTYDTALFSNGISAADYKALLDDKRKPLFNRAISSAQSPGSTFKIVTTIAAAQAGIFDPRRTAYCKGYYEIGKSKPKCTGNHGAISFYQAFTRSCNAYFMDLALKVGKDRLRQTALDLGLGNRTGVDLPGESKGIVPTDEWIRTIRGQKPDEPVVWYLGNTANMGIGQGDLITTPLQMAMIVGMAATNGKICTPHLVKSIQRQNTTMPTKVASRQIQVQNDVWDDLHAAMLNVISAGTGRRAQIPGVRWGGKTGSTEHRKGRQTHSWFVGVAPMDDPKIAIAVLVENAGHGGDVAAPMAAQIVRHYLSSLPSASSSTAANR